MMTVGQPKGYLNKIALVSGLVVSGITFSSFFAPAKADVLFSNLNEPSGGTAFVSSLDHGPLANSFSTSSNSVDLTSVELSLGTNNPNDGNGVLLGLLSDNNTSPSTELTLIDLILDSDLTTSLANYTYTLATPYTLAANTRYWIQLLEPTGDTSTFWSYSANDQGTGVANEYNFYKGSVSANSAFTPFQMQVNVSNAVPEPLNILGATTGIALLGTVSRSLKRRKVSK